MDLDAAIAAHAQWKVRLRTAIREKQSLDAKTLSKDDQCPLGQWLHREARARLAGLNGYAPCLQAHAAFHTEAAKVAAAVNSAKYDEALAMLDSTAYGQASSKVVLTLAALRKEAGL
jgi:hypothetical protein